jgi:pseudaminic acid biosynthesis-associated methylase
MTEMTPQMHVWSDEFGKEYTDRNHRTLDELDKFYTNQYNTSRTEMNQRFLGHLERSLRILEVGSNTGNQLSILQKMGFSDLWGIEIQWYAVEVSRKSTKRVNIVHASALDIPFKDGFFDLVFTSGVLIHIAPDTLPQVLQEIYRCSKEYIWGFEYWAETFTEIEYRGNSNLLWKADYAHLYQEQFNDLSLLQKEYYPYNHNSDLVDSMFLLRKK